MAEDTTSEFMDVTDRGIVEESALARAQATMYNAMLSARITKAELARRMGKSRAFVSQIFRSGHNLTVKTVARAMHACGFEVGFERLMLGNSWIRVDVPGLINEAREQTMSESAVGGGLEWAWLHAHSSVPLMDSEVGDTGDLRC